MKHTTAILASSILLGLGTAHAVAQTTTDDAATDLDQSSETSSPNTVGADGASAYGGSKALGDLEPVDPEEFVETASAKSMAEIESAEVALEKGSDRVQEYARKMIDEHRQANQDLADIAQESGLDVSEDPGLIDQTKTMILDVRDGESFDEAYVNNQIEAHEDTIELFQRAAESDHQQISAYAQETLPKLEMHLEEARELQRQTVSSTSG